MADALVTVQTVIDNTIVRQKDSQKFDWPDTELLVYFNKARDYIHKMLVAENEEIAISTGSIALAATTQEYALSGNVDDLWKIAPSGVYFSTGPVFLYPISVEDKIRAGATTTNTAPTGYYLTSSSLGLIPIPTLTAVGLYPTVNIRYFKKEQDLSLTSYMPYKNLFNESISAFVSSMALLRLGVDSSEYTTLYNSLEESVRAILKQRSQL